MPFTRALLVLALLLALPATATARSVRDPDIGWPEKLRHELRLARPSTRACTRDLTRAMRALQDRVDDHSPFEALRAIFHYRWGDAWYDPCDGGRLKVGVPPAPAAAVRRTVLQARALVARRGLARDVALVAVRSTYRELSDAQDRLDAQFDDLYRQALIESGIETDRNTIVYEVARPVQGADWQRLADAALRAPVNVVLHRVNRDDLVATQLR